MHAHCSLLYVDILSVSMYVILFHYFGIINFNVISLMKNRG